MRIALLHPTYWPEVRRGAERLVHDLGAALAAQGHEVSVLTSAPGADRGTSYENGVRVVRGRRLPDPDLARRGYEANLANIPTTIARLVGGDYDVVHAFSLTDAWAAAVARRLIRAPLVFSLTGAVDERSLASRRGRSRMLALVARHATAITALSEFAASVVGRSSGVRARVLPPGVFTAAFAPDGNRSPRPAVKLRPGAPVVLCAAASEDPRKRVPLLVEAFDRLRERHPDARLALLGRSDSAAGPGRVGLAADDAAAVVWAYADATISALAAVDEAFGLVLVESLAAGVPVVAARSGASGEVVNDDRIGRLFEPDDADSLLAALEATIELADRPETATRCVARAAVFDWQAVLPRYEALYEEVVSVRRAATNA